MKVTAIVTRYVPITGQVPGKVFMQPTAAFDVVEYEARQLKRSKEWVWKKTKVLCANARWRAVPVDRPTLLYCGALHNTRLPPCIQDLLHGDESMSVEEAFQRAYMVGELQPGVIHVPLPPRHIATMSCGIQFP